MNLSKSFTLFLPQNATPTEIFVRFKNEATENNINSPFSFIQSFLTFAYEFKSLHSSKSQEAIHTISSLTYADFIQRIKNISSKQLKISIAPGLTVCQALKQLLRINSLHGFLPGEISEGSIHPGYTYIDGIMTYSDFIEPLTKKMGNLINKYWNEIKDTEAILKSPQELLILASLVERETYHNPEKNIIAGVYKNRIKSNMRLQSCPTVIYFITKGCEEFKRKLTYTDLKIESEYNTYRKTGLPPTPICIPGLHSIKSAAYHDINDYLYFVASTKGQHRFSKDFETHKSHKKLWKKELEDFKQKKKKIP